MKAIDLGLSVLWANENYEEDGKEFFTWEEANAIKFHDGWRLPTKEELEELNRHASRCESRKIGEERTVGWVFANGGDEIFLPMSGFYHGPQDLMICRKIASYWSSTLKNDDFAYELTFGEDSMGEFTLVKSSSTHDYGFSIRLVKECKRISKGAQPAHGTPLPLR